jgi:glycosyltransferase involved in cell wall biosynthesis
VAPAEGDADDVRRLRSLASALGVGDRLEVVSGPVVPHLARLDAFVHLPTPPALDPRPVVDAMAAGVPVIAARRGAGAEVVEHEVTGLVVDADDPADLTLQLMRLDADRALRTRLATGSLRRAQDFTPTRAAQALLEVYRKVGS